MIVRSFRLTATRDALGRWRRAALRTVTCAAASAVCAIASAQTVIDLASPYPEANFHVQNLKRFATEVTEATRGSVQIKIHAAGSLVKAPEIFKSVSAGTIGAGEVFGPSLSSVNGVFALDGTPFLVSTYPAARKMWKAVEERVESQLKAQGVTLLMSVPWPPQGMFSSKPIASMKDLQGLTMRENSPPVKRLAEVLEASPVRIETPDLESAAREKRVQLVFTSAAQGMETRLAEHLPNFYAVNAWLPRNVVFINTKVLDALSKEQRDAVLSLAGRAEERGWLMSEQFAASSMQALRKSSAKVRELPPAVRTRLERAGSQIAKESLRAGDPELLGLVMKVLN